MGEQGPGPGFPSPEGTGAGGRCRSQRGSPCQEGEEVQPRALRAEAQEQDPNLLWVKIIIFFLS
jgi:hypothetical protein